MTRAKEFDPDAALLSALELFWERGYEATSIADLVTHLGIARASIYATFGGKHELYLKALERYLQLTGPHIVEMLSQPGPVLPAIRALVARYADKSVYDQRPLGCMVVNTAVELAGHDLEAARLVEASWTQTETALTSALTRARAQSELSASANPQELARLLLVLLAGMRVLGRVPGSQGRLRDAAEQALAILS